jgi:hypothetical protein
MKKMLVIIVALMAAWPVNFACAPGRQVEKKHREREREVDERDVNVMADQYLRNADLFRDQNPYDISDQIQQYQNIITNFPESSAAREAAARIAECKKDPGYGRD